MAAGNVAIVREGFEAFGRRDFDSVLARFDPDIEIRSPDLIGEIFRGHDGYRRFIDEWLEGWEEFRVEPVEFIEAEDWVAVPCRNWARGKGSGVEVEQDFTQIFRLRDGMVVEYWLFGDQEEALRHAGIAP